MLVKMRKHIGGFRNGLEWPPAGGVIDLPDHEAGDLIANGYAEPASPVVMTIEEVRDAEATNDQDSGSADDSDPAGADDGDPQPVDDAGELDADQDPPAEVTAAKPRSRARKPKG